MVHVKQGNLSLSVPEGLAVLGYWDSHDFDTSVSSINPRIVKLVSDSTSELPSHERAKGNCLRKSYDEIFCFCTLKEQMPP